jgi:phage baseplate assembly protein V
MNQLLNEMRKQAQMANSNVSMPKTGIVSGYDQTNYSVKVMLQPEGIETGWLPLLSPWVGNGWGMFCPPSIDDMIDVHFEQGSSEAGFAMLRFFNDVERPLSVPSGEFWLVHKLGGFLKLTNDGKVLINGQAEIDLTAPALNITITGNVALAVSGNITSNAAAWDHTGNFHATGTITGDTDVVGGGKSLKTHQHDVVGITLGGATKRSNGPA